MGGMYWLLVQHEPIDPVRYISTDLRKADMRCGRLRAVTRHMVSGPVAHHTGVTLVKVNTAGDASGLPELLACRYRHLYAAVATGML